MPFNILTPLAAAPLPADVILTNGPVFSGLREVEIEAAPNLDAAGGTLSVVTVGDIEAGETQVLQYTDVDGNMVTADLVLPAGLEIVQAQGVVFGETLNQFMLLVGNFETLDDGNVQSNYSLIEVDVDESGVPSLGIVQPFVEGFRPFTGPTEVSIYALGDGRIGYEHGVSGNDYGIYHGVVSDDADAIAVHPLGGDVDYSAAIVALDDGGLLLVEQEPGTVDGEFAEKQFDAAGVEVASQGFPTAGVYDATGFVEDEMSSVVLINDAGELEVFVTNPEDVEAETYRIEFDLLPLAEEPVIEPPLPPVDGNIPTAGDDVLLGTDGDDVIDALGGNDVVKGFGGKDWIIGGDGDDSIDGGRGDDALISGPVVEPVDGEEGVDALPPQGGLYGSAGEDSINGRMGSDWIEGGDGNDDLRGGLGSDSTYTREDGEVREAGLFGGEGDDFIRGNHGSDWMDGGAGNDDMNGGFGDDFVIGGAGDDKLAGFDGTDIVYGGDGNDVISGGRGNDELDGEAGDDTLRGGDGNDALHGGEGDDLLIGGDGSDSFHYDLTEGAENGTDTIKDFGNGDTINFTSAEGETLTFDDIFLSQEDSHAIIQAGDTTIRLKGVDVEDLGEDDFVFG